jgi:hypothetical protein
MLSSYDDDDDRGPDHSESYSGGLNLGGSSDADLDDYMLRIQSIYDTLQRSTDVTDFSILYRMAAQGWTFAEEAGDGGEARPALLPRLQRLLGIEPPGCGRDKWPSTPAEVEQNIGQRLLVGAVMYMMAPFVQLRAWSEDDARCQIKQGADSMDREEIDDLLVRLHFFTTPLNEQPLAIAGAREETNQRLASLAGSVPGASSAQLAQSLLALRRAREANSRGVGEALPPGTPTAPEYLTPEAQRGLYLRGLLPPMPGPGGDETLQGRRPTGDFAEAALMNQMDPLVVAVQQLQQLLAADRSLSQATGGSAGDGERDASAKIAAVCRSMGTDKGKCGTLPECTVNAAGACRSYGEMARAREDLGGEAGAAAAKKGEKKEESGNERRAREVREAEEVGRERQAEAAHTRKMAALAASATAEAAPAAPTRRTGGEILEETRHRAEAAGVLLDLGRFEEVKEGPSGIQDDKPWDLEHDVAGGDPLAVYVTEVLAGVQDTGREDIDHQRGQVKDLIRRLYSVARRTQVFKAFVGDPALQGLGGGGGWWPFSASVAPAAAVQSQQQHQAVPGGARAGPGGLPAPVQTQEAQQQAEAVAAEAAAAPQQAAPLTPEQQQALLSLVTVDGITLVAALLEAVNSTTTVEEARAAAAEIVISDKRVQNFKHVRPFDKGSSNAGASWGKAGAAGVTAAGVAAGVASMAGVAGVTAVMGVAAAPVAALAYAAHAVTACNDTRETKDFPGGHDGDDTCRVPVELRFRDEWVDTFEEDRLQVYEGTRLPGCEVGVANRKRPIKMMVGRNWQRVVQHNLLPGGYVSSPKWQEGMHGKNPLNRLSYTNEVGEHKCEVESIIKALKCLRCNGTEALTNACPAEPAATKTERETMIQQIAQRGVMRLRSIWAQVLMKRMVVPDLLKWRQRKEKLGIDINDDTLHAVATIRKKVADVVNTSVSFKDALAKATDANLMYYKVLKDRAGSFLGRMKRGIFGGAYDPIGDRYYEVAADAPHDLRENGDPPTLAGGGTVERMGALADAPTADAAEALLDGVATQEQALRLEHEPADQVLSQQQRNFVAARLSRAILWPSQYLQEPQAPPISGEQRKMLATVARGRALSRLLPHREFERLVAGGEAFLTPAQVAFMKKHVSREPMVEDAALRGALLRVAGAT